MLAKSQSESKLVFASSLSLQTGIRITYNSNTNEMRYILYFVLQRMLNLLYRLTDRVKLHFLPQLSSPLFDADFLKQ